MAAKNLQVDIRSRQRVVAQMSEVNGYRALLTREDGIWLIEAVDLLGVRSFGRTVTDAASNIREAIAAAEDLEEWSELELLYTLDDPAATVALPFAAFSSDGSSLMFVDGEYELRRLTLDPEQLVQHATQRLTRGFTEADCNTYLGPELCPQTQHDIGLETDPVPPR